MPSAIGSVPKSAAICRRHHDRPEPEQGTPCRGVRRGGTRALGFEGENASLEAIRRACGRRGLLRREATDTRHWRWADLLRRAFDMDALACPVCGNRMRLLATLEDPRVVQHILTHLGLPSTPVRADPAHPPPTSANLFADTLA